MISPMVWPSFGTGCRVGHHQAVEQRRTHALAGFEPRALLRAFTVPLGFPLAGDAGAVGFGQAVDVGDAKRQRLHGFDHCRGWRGTGGEHFHRLGFQGFQRLIGVSQHIQHDGRTAEMVDAMLGKRRVDGLGAHMAQAHVDPDIGGQRPGEAPAVAVEHRQRPQVHREAAHVPAHGVGQRIQVCATVVIHHALGVTGGAGGVNNIQGISGL